MAAISSMLLGVKVTARASALSFQLPRRSRRGQLSNSSDASATIVVVRRFDVDISDRNYMDAGDVARLGEVDRWYGIRNR